ncbi:DUF1360 domain-containing protein [Nonomuraea sp. B1E8]|uniref:DUF1360 domain-containing protein n=1 Tax=unclassified Nonomuraea TaxID=2593643 RepID=UPI00325DC487
MGELLARPFRLSQWVATAYAAGLAPAPKVTRLVGATMTAVDLRLAAARLRETDEVGPRE